MKAIIDCNSFYCSCERLFKPHLDEAPVVVLSNNDGCIISRSDEAKNLGVGMALPYFMAKDIILKNKIACFSSNYNLYGDLSWRVMETLRAMLGEDKVEVYSVDEAFVDLPEESAGNFYETGLHIKNVVENWTGIKVSVGIAPTKVLCKMANHMAKDDKAGTGCVKVLETQEEIDAALQATPVRDLWGVGRKYAEKLTVSFAIFSAWDLSKQSEEWMRKNMGGVVGVRLQRELNCIPCIGMKEELISKKMIGTSRMFGRNVGCVKDVQEAIATYTSTAAEKLRRQHCAATVISVFVVAKEDQRAASFRHGPIESLYATLPYATSATNELIKPAVSLVEKLFRKGKLYKKAGVMLSGIVPAERVQSNIFTENKTRKQLMTALDNVNFSMRGDVLKFATGGLRRDWKMREEMRSPRYTSRWEEMFEVR